MLKGCTEPRLWTRPARELTPETSLGFEAAEFAEGILGRPLHPWQWWFLVHSLELADGSHTWDEFPVLRFKTVVLLVARQNGKSYIMSTRLLWRMLMWEGPEVEPTLILGTAHKLSLSEEILDLSHKALQRSEELRPLVVKRSNTNGDKHFELANGARYKAEAASDDGGRGLSVTDLGFDELRQQRDWAAWAAMTNTTNARHSAQVIGVSNAGEARSEVLRSLRAKALAEMEAGTGSSLALFEYSAPDDCDIWDREGWAQANPSLGHPGGPTVETIEAAASLVGKPGEGMPEHKFRTEILCQWVTVSEEGPFTQDMIDGCTDPASQIAEDSPLFVAFDVSDDRRMSSVAVAGWRDDGVPHVEVIAQRAYTGWLPKFLAEKLAFTPDAVIAQGRGAPVSSELEFVEDAGVQVVRCEGKDLPAACGQFSDRVEQGTIRWPAQPALTLAMAEAKKKHYGDVWSWDRHKSPVEVSPLCAATFALWGLVNGKAAEKQTSAYAEMGRWW